MESVNLVNQPSMFDQHGIADLGALGGVSGGHLLDWFGHGYWAAKRYDSTKPWTLVSEILCADIASLLGLPIPARRVIPFNGKWLGFEWRGDSKSFCNGMETNLINKDIVPGMIVFDVWICNKDRHSGNVILQRPSEGISQYNLSLIDHSHALIGDLPNLDALRQFIQLNNDPRCFVMPVPQQLRNVVCHLEDYIPWLMKVESFNIEQLDEVIQVIPTEWIPSQEQLASLINFVALRASNVKSLVMDNPQLFVSQRGQGG